MSNYVRVKLKSLTYKILVLLCCFFLNALCNPAIAAKQLDANNKQSYLKSNSELETYLQKIAKRLLMLDSNPALELKFKVKNNNKLNIVRTNTGLIAISRGLLENLHDETQLAAILSYLVIQLKPEFKTITCLNMSKLAYNYDQTCMQVLAKAGYNPVVIIELQELFKKHSKTTGHYLEKIFLATNMPNDRINAAKKQLDKLPKGAIRLPHHYNLTIGIQEN